MVTIEHGSIRVTLEWDARSNRDRAWMVNELEHLLHERVQAQVKTWTQQIKVLAAERMALIDLIADNAFARSEVARLSAELARIERDANAATEREKDPARLQRVQDFLTVVPCITSAEGLSWGVPTRGDPPDRLLAAFDGFLADEALRLALVGGLDRLTGVTP